MNRRHTLSLMAAFGAAGALQGCASASRPATDEGKRTFVMVPGAYTGAWLYARVSERLRAQGHQVHALSFTGLADRQHLMSPDVDVNTHVADIVNLFRFHDLTNVTLVAHSYSGIPATAAADQLGPGTVRALIYIDALVPTDGMGWMDFHTPAQQKGNLDNLNGKGGGTRLLAWNDVPGMMPVLGVNRADAELLARLQTDMPGKTYTSKVQLKNGGYQRFPRTYIECNTPPLATIASTKARIKGEPGWKFAELRTGHVPMLAMPDELTRLFATA